jgi:ectoine hydroxylase-related dioxygenase (phytanoyl-CoA dioxygenase family)
MVGLAALDPPYGIADFFLFRGGRVMSIFEAVWDNPGFLLGHRLAPDELQTVRNLVTQQWVGRIRAIDPVVADEAARIGMANYHLIADRVDHHSIWPKKARLLPVQAIPLLKSMAFYRAIVAEFKDVKLLDDEQIWRLVRPNEENDVGPIHADGWFWDYGNGGNSATPAGYDRFKIWIPLYTEPGRNGLCVVPDSHVRDWKHHDEVRHGITKPVLDERVEDLDVRLLTLNPGEMVMFHDRLLHGGVVNRGNHCRVSFELTIFVHEQFATLAHPNYRALRKSA